MSGQNGTTPNQTHPWDAVISWAREQQRLESISRPLSLTRPQIDAIYSIVPEPDVEGNPIGDLNTHRQINRESAPVFTDEEADASNGGGGATSRWRCYCDLGSSGGRFPRAGYGCAPGEHPPSFSNKKKAKQYAARCAYQYLMNPSQPPGSVSPRQSPPPPVDPSPPSPVVKLEQDEARYEEQDDGAPLQRPSPYVPISQAGQGNSSSVRDRAGRMATHLGFDSPTYNMLRGENGLWHGRPELRFDARMPIDLGFVSGMQTKDQAVDESARDLLAWLVQENRDREEMARRILGE